MPLKRQPRLWDSSHGAACPRGKVKAVTATARKLAVLFYKALRYGRAYVDPGVSVYEGRYRERVVPHLKRRAGRPEREKSPYGAVSAAVGQTATSCVTL